jgi:putative ATP-dependent endonuclease of the OLD family
MKITQFSISRYRTFDDEVCIPLAPFTVFTGPNNLGKSTALKALGLFFGAFQSRRNESGTARQRVDLAQRYDPAQDYPEHRQTAGDNQTETRLRAVISLSEEDRKSAEEKAGMTLPEAITLTAEFDPSSPLRPRPQLACREFRAVRDVRKLQEWFSDEYRFIYIPANRNVNDLQKYLFKEIVAVSLKEIRQSKKRISLVEKFYEDVRRQLSDVERELAAEMRTYVPSIESLEIETHDPDIFDLLSISDIHINDGAKTSLGQKGDGVKSLFVISVLQLLAKQRYGKNLIFGIEEPEAHLHSSAVYDLKASLRDMSKSFQIIVTTHSPILIERDDLSSNIVIGQLDGEVFTCSAAPAKNLGEIRQSLGIKPQDNMITAEVVIVVEGATEEQCLGALLRAHVPEFSRALDDGRVRVVHAGGASKIMSVVRALARDATSCIVLVDSDAEGRKAVEGLKKSGLINPADIFNVPERVGCEETEFEDAFPPDIWLEAVAESCGIHLDVPTFEQERARTGGKGVKYKKWSAVMVEVMAKRGKSWDDLKDVAKESVGRAVSRGASRLRDDDAAWIKSIGARALRLLAEQ